MEQTDSFRQGSEYGRLTNSLAELEAKLAANPGLLRSPLTRETDPDLYNTMGKILNALTSEPSAHMRGDDYLELDLLLDQTQRAWLKQHSYVARLNQQPGKAISEKTGRLGLVVAALEADTREQVARAIRDADLKPNARDQAHVARLLTHINAPECTAFAISFIQNQNKYIGMRLAAKPPETAIPASTDGNNAFQFWTYGPYVLQALIERGENFDTFMTQWVMKRTRGTDAYLNNALYPGIEGLYADDTPRNYHYLTKHSASLSHGFADFIARNAILPAIEEAR